MKKQILASDGKAYVKQNLEVLPDALTATVGQVATVTAGGNVAFVDPYLKSGGTISGALIANSFKLPNSTLTNLFENAVNDPYLNVRVIQSKSNLNSDGLYVGFDNTAAANTRIYDGSTTKYVSLFGGVMSTVGFTKFLFGNQADDGTFAQFSGDVAFKTNAIHGGDVYPSTDGGFNLGISGKAWGQARITAINTEVIRERFGGSNVKFQKNDNTNLATLFSTGNLLVQNGGSHVDSGYRIDANGTSRFFGSDTNVSSTVFALIENKSTGGARVDFKKNNEATWGVGIINNNFTICKSGVANHFNIANGGNVGLGVDPSSTNSKLDIYTLGTANALQLRAGNATGLYTSNQILFGFDGTNNYNHAIKTRHNSAATTDNAIDFYLWNRGVDVLGTVGTYNAMSLTLSGVGFGVTAPTARVHIAGGGLKIEANGSNQNALTFVDTNTGGNQWFMGQGVGTGLATGFSLLYNATAGSSILYALSNGNIGVKTVAPAYPLDVNGTARATAMISSSFKLPNSGQANLYENGTDDNYLNVRVIRNLSGVNADGLYIGYGNSGSGNTRFYDGGVANYLSLNGATFSSNGFTKFLFGNQTDNGTFAQFSGAVHAKSTLKVDGAFSFGDLGTRTERTTDAGVAAYSKSGFYDAQDGANFPTGSWWHLINSQHYNSQVGNNYAMQIAGSFFDQKIYFRKTNTNANQAWREFVTSDLAGNAALNGSIEVNGYINTNNVLYLTGSAFAFWDGSYQRMYKRNASPFLSVSNTMSYYDNTQHFFRTEAGVQVAQMDANGISTPYKLSGAKLILGSTVDNGSILQVTGSAYISSFLALGENLGMNNGNFQYWKDNAGNYKRLVGLSSNNMLFGDIDNVVANSANWFYAQNAHLFVNNGIETARFTQGGSFGLGTGTPISLFHSVGTITAGSGNNPSAVGILQLVPVISSPIASRLTYGTDGSGWKFAIAKNQAGVVTDQFVMQDNGDSGFGTSTPKYKVDINGSLGVSGAVSTPIRVITGSAGTYAISATDHVVIIQVSGASTFTVDAPTTANKNRELIIVNKSGANHTLSRSYVDSVSGTNNMIYNANTLRLKYDGTNIQQL